MISHARAAASPFTLKLGDCVEGLKQIDPRSVDVVVTSPPYNIGIDYGAYQDTKSDEEYLDWCEEWAAAIARILKPDGSFFLNLGNSSANPFFAFSVAMRIGKILNLQNTIHWIKAVSIEREEAVTSYGHFKPINSPRFVNDCHEYVFHFTPEGKSRIDRLAVGVPYTDKTNIARWGHTGGRDRRCRGNTWFVPYKTIHQRATQRPHPATFPTELAVKCIRLHGRQNATVLDPFLGIGHSALAAKECSDLVRNFIGFDIDEEYLRVAAEVIGCSYSPI